MATLNKTVRRTRRTPCVQSATQANSASYPILSRMENEYRLKYGDALRLESKGSLHLCVKRAGGRYCVIRR